MQLPTILQIQIAMMFLIQGDTAHANTPNNFGCLDRVPNHPVAGCVVLGPGENEVNLMGPPSNLDISAYDCTRADPSCQRPTCCSELTWVQSVLSVGVWNRECREIDGSEIQKY
ncbi:hypothetical protein MJO28_013132 [Puccinia striiformis f. sp. tritici]|uniref:Uncharacterized protein n=2 Tax=Puccinia striiformis TaxID=27350 RepID=A0ACC0DXF6_9BASI|nr:hypothetical protein MJO28_013132 [Puccinia striiformis f. sp. tritici]